MIQSLMFFCTLIIGMGQIARAEDPSLYEAGLGQWTDSHDKVFHMKELEGHKVVLAMVYTSCQFACPLITKKLKNIKSELGDLKIQSEFVVISFDTKFDTPKKMEIFGKEHDLNGGQWHLLVGSEKDTRFLSNLLGIRFSRNPKDQSISHDNKIVLIDEKGKVVKVLEGLKFDPKEKLF